MRRQSSKVKRVWISGERISIKRVNVDKWKEGFRVIALGFCPVWHCCLLFFSHRWDTKRAARWVDSETSNLLQSPTSQSSRLQTQICTQANVQPSVFLLQCSYGNISCRKPASNCTHPIRRTGTEQVVVCKGTIATPNVAWMCQHSRIGV